MCNIMIKHTYLPLTIIPDKGSDVVSQLIEEVADALGITIQHVTNEHTQMFGKLERTPVSFN